MVVVVVVVVVVVCVCVCGERNSVVGSVMCAAWGSGPGRSLPSPKAGPLCPHLILRSPESQCKGPARSWFALIHIDQ